MSTQNRPILVIASGYFNPLTLAHIRYLQEARKLGSILMVIVNNDQQVQLKEAIPFQTESERCEIISALSCVTSTAIALDTDRSVSQSIKMFVEMLGKETSKLEKIIFANGGDVTTCREAGVCKDLGITCMYGVGGFNKIQSSSLLIEQAAKAWLKKNMVVNLADVL